MTWSVKRLYKLWSEVAAEISIRRNSAEGKHIVMVSAGRKVLPSPHSATQLLLWRAAQRMEREDV